MFNTDQTTIATFINTSLVKNHAGGEEGESVDEDRQNADTEQELDVKMFKQFKVSPAEEAKGSQGGDDRRGPEHEGHDVGHAGHTDRHPRVGERLPETIFQAQFQLLLGEVLVGLDQDEHVVDADAEHEEGEDVVQLGEHQTTGGADAKTEDTAKDDPRKS